MLLDFLLGPDYRKRIKDIVHEWWLWVENLSVRQLLVDDARVVLVFFNQQFGEQLFSAKLVLKSGLLSIMILILGTATIFVSIVDRTPDITNVQVLSLFAICTLVNAYFDYISLAFTMFLLRIMARSVSLVRICLIIVLDLFIVYSLLFIIALSVFVLLYLSVYVLGQSVGTIVFSAPGTYSIAIKDFPIEIIYLVLFTSLLPSLFHLVLAFIFLTSKLLRPLLQQPTSLVLLRLYQSEKGVLTLLAVGCGGVAKLVQEGAKYWSG